MGIRDDLIAAGRTAAAAGRQYVEGVAADMRKAGVDRDIDGKAREAVRAGNDGTHELPGDPARQPKALHFDPFDLVAAMGWREKPTPLTFAALASTAWHVPVIADIIRTRTNQVSMFSRVPEDRHAPGFKVRLRDWRTQPLTPAVEERQQDLERFLLNTGQVDPSEPWKAVPLETFTRVFTADSLAFDQATFEVVPDRRGMPSYFTNVDPTTIRLVDPGSRSGTDSFAVQVIGGSVVSTFKDDELAFCVRNPRSSVRSFGYGTSEIETLIKEITGFLWGMEYNRKFFSQGSATKGILNFKGTIPDKHMQAFRRQWYAMVSGVNNAWRTPITNAEELQWISLQMNNRDMEYSSWIDFLIKVCCARFQIAPEEVNFSYGNTGQGSAMGQPSTVEKIQASKDLGLRPLVRFFFTSLNRHVLWRLDPDFEVVPVGLDSKGPEAEAELASKQTSSFLTVDEVREQQGLAPLGKGRGDCLLNPTWLQYTQGQQGDPGADPNADPNAGQDPDAAMPDGSAGPHDFSVNDEDGGPGEDDFDVSDDDFDGGADQVTKATSAANPVRRVRYEVDVD